MDAHQPSQASANAEAVLKSPALRFNIAGLPALTAYLDEQMTDAALYSLENNVGILKIYTLYPHIADHIVIQKVLVQCLTRLPANDFDVCIAQVPIPTQEHPVIAEVISLHNMLQNCLFYKFWEAALKPMDDKVGLPFVDVPGLRDAVRRFILDVVPLLYMQMSVPELRSMLNYERNCEEFEQMLAACRWTLTSDYSRSNPDAGMCVPAARDDIAKSQRSHEVHTEVNKYFKVDSMRVYYSTMRHAA
ncbi:EUKARYOTIC TRANSLATION INITIATION FACTOR 3 SUBUNIT 11, putative [Babesia bigemina]|uniref:Eukaryotic translation initiation factor 3 subunit K n=1 Tax=Babesia bigemina TaxID=5866 RepID=A0A061DE58_BABBI|nr:EUKARYOTIC TRANSLATION INITIATION FACTOR 3 SUBUNIT 11, putative [Babesia bigemina]CDR96845.1 EUKARYOTIC TRANSLATION INITIATION FACTOR 3 SUBUNIT 11, putative [Babesia bigemina]|eukprot:XP_012769031.1 EUKARYOTIC TRANSLATION INITIATION FACTOR 3 SUBUNIT 11, putative [Babesia bigemina]